MAGLSQTAQESNSVGDAQASVGDPSTIAHRQQPSSQPENSPPSPDEEPRLVLLLDVTGKKHDTISERLAPFGYWVDEIGRRDDLSDILKRRKPSHLIIRIDGSILGQKTLEMIEYMDDRTSLPPMIVLSQDISMQTRLAAVRAGVSTFLGEPLNMIALVDRLEATRRDKEHAPYRILIVDDDKTIAKFHATVLGAAGMEVLSLHDPNKVFDQLSEFRPELILMDHFMPEVQGRELAQVIRQEPTYDSIPIVFLSNEDDRREQLILMRTGGDDFLTKPINAELLVNAIATRAERFRALRATMLRDSLTGLLNHTAIKERLNVDFGRAKRTGSPLSLVLLDLDHFKTVNDTHGHPVGDQVLKSLSHLLKQRLRATDVIGRYGGEEFVVVMPDTPQDAALRVINEVRDAFAQVSHPSPNGAFVVTLSAGIASHENEGAYKKASEMMKAADEALYEAKGNGRNRVETAA